MVGAFFMPGEIKAFLCPFLRKEVSTVANRIMGITVEIGGNTAAAGASSWWNYGNMKCISVLIYAARELK